MLTNEDAAVDGNDVVFGEGFLQLSAGEVVILRLTIGGEKDSTVDDEEVGVCGREAMAIVGVVDGRWQREGEQIIIDD